MLQILQVFLLSFSIYINKECLLVFTFKILHMVFERIMEIMFCLCFDEKIHKTSKLVSRLLEQFEYSFLGAFMKEKNFKFDAQLLLNFLVANFMSFMRNLPFKPSFL